ncbi:transcriptional regulator [Aureimonas endophytica]|uniref:Transcriptional regulator n=1 Tax=Aureimonas endophytica TaxID=2027858 RepID=A0A916ZWY9_9HYPH|nr:LacI family DNA-binding transcriptional regulator [Aureimonas endophytica]GGE17393.1 transcriptional regulator [Aureimonas endophytica]
MNDGSERAAPTLSDVARHAGVSLATADRVVNRRAGVRAATIERVEAAIRDLRFERHAGAAALARRAGFRAVALLPRGTNPFIARLAEELSEAARIEGLRRLDLSVETVDGFDAARLAEAIRRAGAEAEGLIAIGLDDPGVALAIDELAARGVPLVTLVSDVPGAARARYVGIDNRAAGRVAASLVGRFAPPGEGRVLVLIGSRDLRDHRDRLEGFRETLAGGFAHLRPLGIVEGQDDAGQSFAAVRQALAAAPEPPVAVYSAGAGVAGLAAALHEAGLRPVVVAHELTDETRPLLESQALDALIVQDPGHEARSAVRVLMAALAGTALSEDQERIRIEIILKDNLPK